MRRQAASSTLAADELVVGARRVGEAQRDRAEHALPVGEARVVAGEHGLPDPRHGIQREGRGDLGVLAAGAGSAATGR